MDVIIIVVRRDICTGAAPAIDIIWTGDISGASGIATGSTATGVAAIAGDSLSVCISTHPIRFPGVKGC